MKKENFTAVRIAEFRCEPGQKQRLFWDGRTPGLGLRVMASGTKSYIFETSMNGKTIRITIGDVATWTLSKAQKEATEYKGKTDKGIDPRAEKAAANTAVIVAKAAADAKDLREAVTLGSVWPIYIAARTPHWGKRTLADHLKLIKPGGEPRVRSKEKFTKPAPLASLANVRLVDLTMERIAEWAEIEGAVRATSARLAHRLLKACLNWCEEQADYKGIHSKNPAKSTRAREALGEAEPKTDALERQQLTAWFKAVKGLSPVVAAYLQVLLLTGARPTEILEMRWEDVNNRWQVITIRDKIEGIRQIPLTPYTEYLLSTLPRRNDWVFSNENDHITSPNYQLHAVCALIQIDPLTLNGVRRSFKSLTEWMELPTGVVAQLMGHKPSATAEKHYTVRPIDLLRIFHVRIETWILEQAGVGIEPAPTGLRLVTNA